MRKIRRGYKQGGRRGYKQGGLVEKIDPEKYVETYEDGSKLYKINSFVRDILVKMKLMKYSNTNKE